MSCLADVTSFILGAWGQETGDGVGGSEGQGASELHGIRTENGFPKDKENRACSWKQLEWILDDPKSTNVHYQSFTLR